MLDNEAKIVYEALKKLTGGDDVYRVLEADEIIAQLSIDMTKMQLSSLIRDLRDREYIKVKYFTPDEYCLLTVKRTEEIAQMVENVVAVSSPERESAPPQNGKANIGWKVFLCAFFGAFLGGGLVTAIAIILQIFVFK